MRFKTTPLLLGLVSIDAFVLARLEEEGLAHAPRADCTTLIRRLYFNLIGLPPTPEEVEEFLKGAAGSAPHPTVGLPTRNQSGNLRSPRVRGQEKVEAASVWPFTFKTVSSFIASLGVPLILTVLTQVLQRLLGLN